jgi:thiol-disulfide isomerase/thioredoxin
MKRAHVGWSLSFVVLSLVVGVVWAAEGGKKAEEIAKEGYWGKEDTWADHSKLLGQAAPALNLSDWHGTPVMAADIKGKIVVVDFWATWCGPCKAAVPHNNELAKKYADKGVVVVGACGGGQEERMNAVVDETKMEYPTGKATNETTKAWGVKWWPHYVVVDRKGTIRAVGIQPDFVEKVIEALMAEPGGDGKGAK